MDISDDYKSPGAKRHDYQAGQFISPGGSTHQVKRGGIFAAV
jgi:hypothetical protein